MDDNCVFCKIKKGEIPSTILYKDDVFMIIKDINPQAKIHLVAIPNNHFSYLEDMTKQDENNLGYIFSKISNLQKELGITDGYRLIINQGENANQTVKHLHIHILGGEKLQDF